MPTTVACSWHFHLIFILWRSRLFYGTDIFICMEIIKHKKYQTEVKCNNTTCNKVFMKDNSEIKRNKKRGSGNYCSLSCSSKISVKKLLDSGEHLNNLKIGHDKSDKYTGLREHLRRAKYRTREVNITLDDLLEQWNKQDGVCPYTGVNLIHPIRIKDESLIHMASLDRIDSNLGYINGNIQFISAAANMAKNNMTHEQMVEFCKVIANKWYVL
jgi:hypothetical protein